MTKAGLEAVCASCPVRASGEIRPGLAYATPLNGGPSTIYATTGIGPEGGVAQIVAGCQGPEGRLDRVCGAGLGKYSLAQAVRLRFGAAATPEEINASLRPANPSELMPPQRHSLPGRMYIAGFAPGEWEERQNRIPNYNPPGYETAERAILTRAVSGPSTGILKGTAVLLSELQPAAAEAASGQPRHNIQIGREGLRAPIDVDIEAGRELGEFGKLALALHAYVHTPLAAAHSTGGSVHN